MTYEKKNITNYKWMEIIAKLYTSIDDTIKPWE
jgi:hypothetical protein